MKKEINSISLCGQWEMNFYEDGEYLSEKAPEFSGCNMKNAVPAYWEDMIDDFGETFIYEHLKWNPAYAPQKYPIAGYVPDMALPNILGCFFYRRSFDVELLAENTCAELYIGGAQNTVSAWINGTYLGIHRGYSAPFAFAVPSEILREGNNEIILSVSNYRLCGYKNRPVSGCTSRAANDCTGGIYGDVEIRFFTSSLKSPAIITSPDLSSFAVALDKAAEGDVKVEILDKGSAIAEGLIKSGEERCIFSSADMKLWSPDSPYLYTVRVSDGLASVSRKFGIRRLVADGTRLVLNGSPIIARGICEHCYFPLTVHPTRDKNYYRNNIRILKNLGFNFIRFHTSVPMAEYMEAADELGMLIEIESPNNTTREEWSEIISFTSKYTSPVIYSSGNEMIIDEDYIEHLRSIAEELHEKTDSLMSPMSAMRGIEYYDFGSDPVDEPFTHNPVRLKALGEFCDLYNSYPNGQLSYISASADPEYVDKCNTVYKKPILSHEICINGTYCDLSLSPRYKGTRIGETALFSSVEKHLEKKGLLARAPLYYKNSSEWQRRLRKQCFEAARRCESLAGYDYLGDIDHHWHTFGYHVGMMNEFYELKPGETVRNVRRYNSDAVLLCDLPYNVNYEEGSLVRLPLLISNYKRYIDSAALRIRAVSEGKIVYKKNLTVRDIENGRISELTKISFVMPKFDTPRSLKLSVELEGDDFTVENEWELYSFPRAAFSLPTKAEQKAIGVSFYTDISEEKLVSLMRRGESVVLFGTGPFATLPTSFQIALAGRTAGHLATVISDNPMMEDFCHEGFCSWQFRSMLDGGKSAVLDLADIPFEPLVEAVSTYKYAHREALIFEYRIGEGRLLVCTLNLDKNDAGARWLKKHIADYAMSDSFAPKHSLTEPELISLFNTNPIYVAENTNMARNTNDITA